MVWLFLNLSILLGVAAAILHYTTITSDLRWERWCGQALIFTLVPVLITPIAKIMKISLNPIYPIGLIWALILLLYAIAGARAAVREKKEMAEAGVWKCGRCHEINSKLNLACWKCSAPRSGPGLK